MERKATRYLLLGQICLFAAAAICYALLPQYLNGGGGASNYGAHQETVWYFSLGLGGCGLFTALAAHNLVAKPATDTLAKALGVLAALFIAVLLSTYPYQLNDTLDLIHKVTAVLLFVYEISLGAWLAWRVSRNTANITLFIILLTGSLLAVLSLRQVLHQLFLAQIMAALSFGILLVRATAQAQK